MYRSTTLENGVRVVTHAVPGLRSCSIAALIDAARAHCPRVKKNGIDLQKKCPVPVNALGVKIDPKDQATLRVWKQEGIDQFVKK